MNLKFKVAFKSLAIAMMICLTNLYVFASPPTPMGVLDSSDAQTVSVNGNSAENGMTIVSGTELKTSENGATVQIRQLGEIQLGANTSATLVFNNGNVDVKLSAGQAQLTTLKGVNGTMTNNDGKVAKTNSSLASSTVSSDSLDPNAQPNPNRNLSHKQKVGLAFGIIAAVVVITIIIVKNVS